MNDNLPPLPEPIVKIGEGNSTWNKYNASQMQDYARAAIERQSVPADFVEFLKKRASDSYSCSVLVKDALARLAAAPQPQPVQEPVAWRTFDGEGGYSYKPYYENEHYLEYWNNLNPRHLGWVEPLYTKS